jgi:hypothetical protein
MKIKKAIRMRKLILFVICFLFIFTVPVVLARDPSPTTHFYLIEYKRPVQGSGNTSTLHIVFYDKIESRQAEAFLRSELERLIKLIPPKCTILAVAWHSTGDYLTERMIKLPDGSHSLIYDLKKKQIFTAIQLWGNEPPPLRKK